MIILNGTCGRTAFHQDIVVQKHSEVDSVWTSFGRIRVQLSDENTLSSQWQLKNGGSAVQRWLFRVIIAFIVSRQLYKVLPFRTPMASL